MDKTDADFAAGRIVPATTVRSEQAHAFVTARKGFCYLTIRFLGRNRELMRVRAYKIARVEKRDMRRLYPEVIFDWKKITEQLAEKREACRRYRTRPRRTASRRMREDEPLFGIYEPGTRTIFTNGIPSTLAGVGRLLDAVVQLDRKMAAPAPPERARSSTRPELKVVQGGKLPKPW